MPRGRSEKRVVLWSAIGAAAVLIVVPLAALQAVGIILFGIAMFNIGRNW